MPVFVVADKRAASSMDIQGKTLLPLATEFIRLYLNAHERNLSRLLFRMSANFSKLLCAFSLIGINPSRHPSRKINHFPANSPHSCPIIAPQVLTHCFPRPPKTADPSTTNGKT